MHHINIPVFIPHLGCPHTCVFCNQRTISGCKSFDISSVTKQIDQVLSSVNTEDTEAQIAFFGGSFTGIDRSLMKELLDIAADYCKNSIVESIRLSTRPDYINDEIINILSSYPVSTIELGIQSMSDRVLKVSERGHTAAQTYTACELIKNAGFSLVGQMMTSLPSSTLEDDIFTAKEICRMKSDAARIYPTVVLRETKLADMYKNGEYILPSNEEAIKRAVGALSVFVENNVKVIRIGLCSADNLIGDDSDVCSDTYDPAIGEIVWNEFYLDKIRKSLNGTNISEKNLVIECPRGEISKVCGQHKKNKITICREYNVKNVKIIENDTISGYNIRIYET